ncbi:MAG: ABC transporter ATP-binding protein [Candidatus Erginobacter occultus]|nr:ABC transporter ATP-binding protein [Candidatus Erginobacter occultus]
MNNPHSNQSDDSFLCAQEVTRVFRIGKRELPILKGVDLTLGRGEIAVLAGPSGAGKSTLLHILGGLDLPTSGRVFLDGEDVFRLGRRQRARLRSEKVGFVFQFFHLLPEFKAWENVIMPRRIRAAGSGLTGRLRDEAARLLDLVGMTGRMEHYPSQLSGGEQQRVAVARSLANDPGLILADEPTGNLDTRSGGELLDLFGKLHSQTGKTLLLVSHDKQVADWSPRVIHIRDGLIEETG